MRPIYGRQLVPDEGGADVERVPLHFNNLYRLVLGYSLHNRRRRLAWDPLVSSFLLGQIRVGKVNQRETDRVRGLEFGARFRVSKGLGFQVFERQ